MSLFAVCACGSQKLQQECCSRYHDGELPSNAQILMRSRYAAYALGLADYIIDTTHRTSPQRNLNRAKWRNEVLQFCKDTQFEGLEIREFVDGAKTATVTFTAKLTQAGKDATFTEKSLFVKEAERWFYKSGQPLPDPFSLSNRLSR